MKIRITSTLLFVLSLFALSLRAADAPATLPANAPQPATVSATTVKKSAITLDFGAVALPKGTRLEVLGKEGDYLLVRFRSARGKILLTDTDFDPTTPVKETSRTPAKDKPATLPVEAKQSTGQTPGGQKPATAATPPALSTNPLDQQPTTNYGKMVQKAKAAEEAHKDKLVDPANEVLDEKPKK